MAEVISNAHRLSGHDELRQEFAHFAALLRRLADEEDTGEALTDPDAGGWVRLADVYRDAEVMPIPSWWRRAWKWLNS